MDHRSLHDKVEQYCLRFNEAVASGDFAPFVAGFADDAAMDIEGNPYGPFGGREQIAAAYATQPPTDTMILTEIEPVDDDTARATFTWSSGSRGAITIVWDDDLVGEVHLTMVAASTARE